MPYSALRDGGTGSRVAASADTLSWTQDTRWRARPPASPCVGVAVFKRREVRWARKKALPILPDLSNGAVRHRAVCVRACVCAQARLRMCTPSRWKAAPPSWWRRRPAPVLSSSSRKARTSPARSVLAQRSCSVRRCAGAWVRGARCPRSGPPCALLTQCPHSAGLGLTPQPRHALAPRHTCTSGPPRRGHVSLSRPGCAAMDVRQVPGLSSVLWLAVAWRRQTAAVDGPEYAEAVAATPVRVQAHTHAAAFLAASRLLPQRRSRAMSASTGPDKPPPPLASAPPTPPSQALFACVLSAQPPRARARARACTRAFGHLARAPAGSRVGSLAATPLRCHAVVLAQLTRANACVVQVNVYDMAENTTAPTYELAGTDMLLNTGYC